jgi:glycosyltransferase involved in cell wall biosynthesis
MSSDFTSSTASRPRIACVIPSYKVRDHIFSVLGKIGSEVSLIYVVDDCCPVQSGKLVEEQCEDPRVKVIYNQQNMGVGGAVLAGYRAAIAGGADVIVKIDGDDQMDPALVPQFVAPILTGEADYVKGNRFFNPEALSQMPFIRIFGNSCLSFLAKMSTGYWSLFDPTNGYTAIHAKVAELLPMDKISKRYFFETDILFRLNSLNAVAVDLPMNASYGDEVSNLKIHKIIPEFLAKHARNTAKRFLYKYLIRDFSVATVEFFCGVALTAFGLLYGIFRWNESANGLPATAGAVMLAALPLMIGIQLLLAFLSYDIQTSPKRPLHPSLLSRLRMAQNIAPSAAPKSSQITLPHE